MLAIMLPCRLLGVLEEKVQYSQLTMLPKHALFKFTFDPKKQKNAVCYNSSGGCLAFV